MEQRLRVHVATVLHVDTHGAPAVHSGSWTRGHPEVTWRAVQWGRVLRFCLGQGRHLSSFLCSAWTARPQNPRLAWWGPWMAVLCPSYDTTVLTLSGVMWNLLVPCCPPHPHPHGCPSEEDVPCPGTVPGSSPVSRAAVAPGLSSSLKPGLRRLKAGVPHAALCM